MMKILVATSSHAPDDDRIYHKQIISFLEKGFEVLLATRNQPEMNADQALFRHVDTPAPNLKAFGNALEELTTSFQPDIVMIHDFELLLTGSRIKRHHGIKLVYDVHEAHRELWDLVSSRRFPVKHIINWGLERYERSFLKYVDHVLTVSPVLKTRYERWGQSTTLIPNFPRLRSCSGTAPREPVVIYQGQLSVERGLVTLIQAFAGVPDTKPDARLEIIGPERRPGLIALLKDVTHRLDLENNVIFREPIPQQALLDHLCEVQIGAIPFPDHPVFHIAVPIKLFEYLLCGCTVVTSDLAMTRKYAEGAVVLVPPGDVNALRQALSNILLNDAKREELAQRGRMLVEKKYNWHRVEPDLLSSLEAMA